MSVEPLHAGGYRVRGCDQEISYTCVRGVCVPYGGGGAAAAASAEPPPLPSASETAARALVDLHAAEVLACAPAAAAMAVDLSWSAGALRASVRGGDDGTNQCVGAVFVLLSLPPGTTVGL